MIVLGTLVFKGKNGIETSAQLSCFIFQCHEVETEQSSRCYDNATFLEVRLLMENWARRDNVPFRKVDNSGWRTLV
jgi:hypothetical protein